MSSRALFTAVVLSLGVAPALGDEVLYLYEGDVLPYDESAGWMIFNPCEESCSESLEDGHFVLQWAEFADLVNYDYEIAVPPEQPPPTLWVEWRFRSDEPRPSGRYGCDAWFVLHYGGMNEVVYMHGDSVVGASGDDVVNGLDIDEFHTLRYESPDGMNYRIAVDGLVFISSEDDSPNGYHYIQLGGHGGCDLDFFPTVNEWDYVRFGTLGQGERIVAADPPPGYLDPEEHPELDRFTVTFEAPNFVFLNNVTLDVTGGVAPSVIQVRRRENDGPSTVEIVLDGPIPMGERTTFYFDTGQGERFMPGYSFFYTYTPGDTIPAVSEWGVVLMTLLLLTAGTIAFRRVPRLST